MRFKKVLLIALFATGSFTFANDNKKEEIKETKTIVLKATISEETADYCSITITRTTTTTIGSSTMVETSEATGTGTTCAEAEADARERLNN